MNTPRIDDWMDQDAEIGGARRGAIESAGRIGSCAVCGWDLPLRLPGRREHGTSWVCVGCGARYEAVFDQSARREMWQNVRPAALPFDRRQLVQPPQAIADFVRRMKEDCEFDDRRCAARHRIVTHAVVIPVNESYHPVGEPFLAMTRDISTTGLSLLHTRAVESQWLVVELPSTSGEVMQVVMRVVRCQPLGRFYEIAGPFMVRMAT